MAFTEVQKAWNSSAGTTPSPATTTLSLPSVAAGHLVVVAVCYLGASTGFTLTITDGNGHTFTQPTGSPFAYSGGARFIWLGYILSAASGSMTITATPSVAHGLSIHAIEFSYTGGSCSFDKTANAGPSTGTTPINTPSLTPTNAAELIYAAGISDPASAGTISAVGGSWVEGTRGTINSDGNNSADAYQLSISAATAVNWTVSGSSNTGWNAASMAFSISGNANVSPGGLSSTTSLGTAAASGTANVSPAGVSSTSSIGSAVATGGAVFAPTGFSSTAALGAAVITGSATVAATGMAASTALGIAPASGTASVSVTGVAATGIAGSAIVGITINAAGLIASAALGTAVASGSAEVSISGNSAAASLGAVSAFGDGDVNAAVMPAVSALGTVAASGSAAVAPAGVSATFQVGVPTYSLSSIVGGVQALASLGEVSASGSAVFSAAGQEAVSFLGLVSVTATHAAKRLPTLSIMGI
jgi:hypothetical protein